MLNSKHLNIFFTLIIFCLFIENSSYAAPSPSTVDFLTQHLPTLEPQYRLRCPSLLEGSPNPDDPVNTEKRKSKETLNITMLPLNEEAPVFFQEIIPSEKQKQAGAKTEFLISFIGGIDQYKRPVVKAVKRKEVDFNALGRSHTSSGRQFFYMGRAEREQVYDRKGYSEKAKEEAEILLKVLRYRDQSKMIEAFKQETKNLSYQRKLEIITALANSFVKNYDMKRTEKDPNNKRCKGGVPNMMLIKGIRDGSQNKSNNEIGVCRDIHLAAGSFAMASKMLKNVIGLSYRTKESGHLVLAAQPKSYGRLDTINYGNLTTQTGYSGVGLLESNNNNISYGMNFIISDPATNKALFVVPTRMLLDLAQLSNGSTDDLIYGHREQVNGDMRIGIKRGRHTVTAGTKVMGQGTPGTTRGIFYAYANDGSLVEVDTAIGYYTNQRQLEKNSQATNHGAFGRVKVGRKIKFGNNNKPGFHGSIGLNVQAMGGTECRGESTEEDCSLGVHGLVSSEIYGSIGHNSEYVDVVLTAQSRLQVTSDEKRNNWNPEHSLKMPQQRLSFTGRLKLKSIIIRLNNELIFTSTNLGTAVTYFNRLGISSTDQRVLLDFIASGRFQDEGTPVWLPGSQYVLSAQGRYVLNDTFTVGVDLNHMPDLDNGFQAMININITLNPGQKRK